MKLVVESKHNVIGRGLVFMVDLNKNKLNEPLKIGDEVTVENKHYLVKGIERAKGVHDDIFHVIGINVKALN